MTAKADLDVPEGKVLIIHPFTFIPCMIFIVRHSIGATFVC